MKDEVTFMLTANSCHENISGSESAHFASIKVVYGRNSGSVFTFITAFINT